MPNGHGGKPAFITPLLLAIGFVVLMRSPISSTLAWAWITIGIVLAGLFGWRLAYDLHMRSADAYGGGYTSADDRSKAQRVYRLRTIAYAIIAIAVALPIMWWRGFFANL